MNYKEIIRNFANWYYCADGDVMNALAGYIAKCPEDIKPWEKARAVAIANYANKIGFDLTEFARQMWRAAHGYATDDNKLIPNF